MINICLENKKTGAEKWFNLPLWEDELNVELNDTFGEIYCDTGAISIKQWDWDKDENDVFPIDASKSIYYINNILTDIEEHPNSDKFEILNFLQYCMFENIETAIENIDKVSFYKHTSLRTIAENYISDNFNLSDYPDIIGESIDYNEVARRLNKFSTYHIVGPNVFHYER